MRTRVSCSDSSTMCEFLAAFISNAADRSSEESTGTPERPRRSSRAPSRARSMSVQSSDSDATPVKRRPKKKPEPIQEESTEEEEEDDEDVEGLLDSE